MAAAATAKALPTTAPTATCMSTTTVLDWQPLHHITFRQAFPGLPEVLVTYHIEAEGESRTRFTVYATKPEGEVPDGVQDQFQQAFDGYFSGLRRAVESGLGTEAFGQP
jgi:hypothetical protein